MNRKGTKHLSTWIQELLEDGKELIKQIADLKTIQLDPEKTG